VDADGSDRETLFRELFDVPSSFFLLVRPAAP